MKHTVAVRVNLIAIMLGLAAGTALAVENVATNSGFWTNAATWSAGVPQPDHDVAIPAGITVTNTGLDMLSINSLSISGTLTHAANAAAEENKINLAVAGSVTIASNGAINVNGKGYGWNGTTAGYGPGGGVGRGGAAHGGQGGQYDGVASLVTYGSVTNPVNLGSGCAGRNNPAQGSAGGGAVLLQVGGTLTVEAGGQITADGNNAQDQSAASGGSVNIAANALAGSGTISANGAACWGAARDGAGGGRIALVATNGTPTQFDTLRINARGGDGNQAGGAGTIFLKAPTQTYGSLVVKNNNIYTPALTTWTNETWRFDSITTTNYGTLAVGTNSVLDFTGTTLVSDSTPASITSRIILYPTYTNRYLFPASFTNAGCLSQSGTNLFPFPGHVTVASNGVLTHETDGVSASTENHKLVLNVAGSLTIEAGGAISVNGRGYGAGAVGYGPGGSTGRWGASYGGQGGEGADGGSFGKTYGSIINPVNWGSGCRGLDPNYSQGGGAVILVVGGTCIIAGGGLITAEGNYIGDRSASAGGSVNITANAFAGTGTINAKGGRGLTNAGGAGGGRIALKAGSGNETQFSSLTITAVSGMTGNGGYADPAAGTIYLEAASQGANRGTVWINNGGAPSPSYTYTSIPPFISAVQGELSQAMVAVTNYGKVLATTNAMIGDLLIYTSCSWTLTNRTLTVGVAEHSLEDRTVSGPGGTNRVDRYGQILWMPIRNTAATAITSTTADLAGTLNAPGTNYDVTAYWSTNNNADAAAWLADAAASSAPAGTFTDVAWQPVTGAAASLSQGTTYYYTLVASNASGAYWASPNVSFRTHATPTVENAGGATSVGLDFATLRGVLTAGTAARAYLVWGDSDPGTQNTGDWQHVESFGWVSQGAVFATNLAGLQLATTYYYRCYVTNDVAGDWSPVTSFSTANTATNSGNWEDAGTWSAGVPQPLDYVYIPAGATVTMNGLGTRSLSSVLLVGTLTHAGNGDTEANKVVLDIAGDLTIGASGSVNVTGKGHGAYQGPGKSSGRGGAAHGGQGGNNGENTQSLVTYGSVTNPVNLGSGTSWNANSRGGGGAVILQVGGAVTHAGLIAADGATTGDAGGGSGGSVNITANAFAGSGTISAKGGNDTVNGGGGGGGRIALIAGSGAAAQFNALAITAAGMKNGGAGTIYLKMPGQTYGALVVKNSGLYTPSLTIWTNQSPHFDSITVTNYGTLAVGTNSVLDFTGTTLVSDSTSNSITSRIVFGPELDRIVWPASFTNAGTLSQSGTNTIAMPGDVVVAPGGIFTHESVGAAAASENNRLDLSIASNLTVQAGGALTVKGKGYGYPNVGGQPGYGPGGSPGRAGASHGGQGANSSDYSASDITYGSVRDPVSYGSGGGGRGLSGGTGGCNGGGAMRVQAGGAVTVNGLISADGSEVGDCSAGSGGSVNISAASFAGSGAVSARGGRGLTNAGGAGGGRIALKAGGGDSAQFGALAISAAGGTTGNGGLQDPAAGTVYLEAGPPGLGRGTVWINNDGQPTANTYTALPPLIDAAPGELSRALVVVTNYGAVAATADATVGELLIYANSSWTLGAWKLYVNSVEHSLEDLAVPGPGATNRVDHYDQVIWRPVRTGTILIVR